MYGTTADLQSAGPCPPPPVTKTINGSVANVALGQSAQVGLAGPIASLFGGGPTNFMLQPVPEGVTADLIAVRSAVAAAGGSITQAANRIIVRRSQNPAANTTLSVLDFNTEGVDPVNRTLTVNNLGADVLSVSVAFGSNLATSASTSVGIFSDVPGTNTNTRVHPTYPTPGANDIHGYSIFTSPVGGAFRALVAYYRQGMDRTVTLGPPLGAVTVTTAATAPSARLRAQYTTQAEYNRGWALSFSQASGGTARNYSVNVTPGYQGASTSFDQTIPDLSGLAGWQAVWGLVTGAQVNWSLSAVGGTATANLDGDVQLTGNRGGSITP
jgi:hypothetical protein